MRVSIREILGFEVGTEVALGTFGSANTDIAYEDGVLFANGGSGPIRTWDAQTGGILGEFGEVGQVRRLAYTARASVPATST